MVLKLVSKYDLIGKVIKISPDWNRAETVIINESMLARLYSQNTIHKIGEDFTCMVSKDNLVEIPDTIVFTP